ncbi:hypothetical protein JZ751_001177 [Albula glossodonta]|uniref:Phospholipase B-like n=1 Tax=Albula glossodonta TaxID=121402 RepID=A0A8T2PSS7_9TELE|nr:hypothetical protein JZ751_001177 [Albula glossodonta]
MPVACAVWWAYLEVKTNGKYNDSLQAYAAGAVEAAVSSQLVYKHWMNTMMGYCGPFKYEIGYCQRLRNYILANLQWMEQQMNKGEDLEYWYQIRLALLQLRGLEDSYNDQVVFPTGQFSVNPFGFLLFQMGGDLEDLEAALNKTSQSRTLGSGSCSALIKLLPGNKELLVSHDTWNNYQSMLRIMKKYSFSYRRSSEDDTPIPGSIQAFSSYPGSIFSGDDFYILSSGLVTLETTIGNSNPELWKFVTPKGTVMEWLRNIVANRLAESGKQWAGHFSKYNSGTYYEEVFNASGCPELVQKYGDWFSFDMNPRAQIFRRNHSLVVDMDSMVRLMRYNNFNEDPLSKCQGCDPPNNGENAISARSDLNPSNGTYPFGALKQRPHGGTDMKLTSYAMHREYQLLAVSGPTCDQVPAFQWSTSPYSGLLHMGHPDRWAFPTISVRWG